MVVRMRHNRSQTKQRRSHHGLTAPAISTCSNCGELHRTHTMCANCGFYKGRLVIDVAAQKAKRDERLKKKREMIEGALNQGVDASVPEAEAADTASTEKTEK